MLARLAAGCLGAGLLAIAMPGLAQATEYYVGEPVVKEGIQLVPNYLVGIEMDKMPAGMDMGSQDVVHIECDAHATKEEKHGFSEDSWIPYLTIKYTLTKEGTSFKKTGKLFAMTAGDGPHYANNVKMDGPGTYHLAYVVEPPSANGFLRHVDKATGVPDWWKPITASWTFQYPSKAKAD